MMRRALASLALTTLLAPLAAEAGAGGRWVAVSVLDLDQQEASEYNGRLDPGVLERLLGEDPPAWIRLERVHWHMDEGIEDQARIGIEWGYSPVSVFPTARITRIIPLSAQRAALLEGRLPAD